MGFWRIFYDLGVGCVGSALEGGRKGRIFSNHSALNSAAGIAKVALIMFLAFFIEQHYNDTPFLGNFSLKISGGSALKGCFLGKKSRSIHLLQIEKNACEVLKIGIGGEQFGTENRMLWLQSKGRFCPYSGR